MTFNKNISKVEFEASTATDLRKGSRNEAIDLGRVIGSIAVISAHIAPGDVWTERVASVTISCHVPFFYLVAMIFFISSLYKNRNSNDITKKQGRRILIPLFSWTLIYSLMIWSKGMITAQSRVWDWAGILLYGQGAVHLYFLSVLFWMQMVALAVFEISCRRSRLLWGLILSGCALFAWWGLMKEYTGWQSWMVGPIFLSLAWIISYPYGQSKPSSLTGEKRNRTVMIGVGSALLILASILNLKGIKFTLFHYHLTPVIGAVGFYLFLANLRLRLTSKFSVFVLSASYGVYLCHFLFIEGIELLLKKSGILPSMYSWPQELIFTIVVFFLSLVAVWSIRKFTLLRGFLLGEG